MKTERNIWIASTAGVIAIIAVFLFGCFMPLSEYAKLSVIFLGIDVLLIVIGLFAIAVLLLWQLGQINTTQIEEDKKRAERDHSIICMSDLKKDAEIRRDIEHERNRINDLFRLIELAKEKPEEITDKSKTKEKGDSPKSITNDKITKKTEGLDTEKLTILINHYQSLNSNQQTNIR